MPLESYFEKGRLKRQRINFKQIQKQLVRATKDLETARLLLGKDPEWASTIAYQAMLRAGRSEYPGGWWLFALQSKRRVI